MRPLKSIALCLGIAMAAEPAAAQQPEVNTLQQQVDAAIAAQGNSPEALAARDKLRSEVDAARGAPETPAPAAEAAAKPEPATVPGVQNRSTTAGAAPAAPAASAAVRHGGGSAPGLPPSAAPAAAAEPTAASAGIRRIPIPPPSGVGVNAPFAHDYFARFEYRPKPATAPFLQGLALRGTVHAASLQQQIDADLAHERAQIDQKDADRPASDSARKQARLRLPFDQVVPQHAAASAKPRRSPKPPFEELN